MIFKSISRDIEPAPCTAVLNHQSSIANFYRALIASSSKYTKECNWNAKGRYKDRGDISWDKN